VSRRTVQEFCRARELIDPGVRDDAIANRRSVAILEEIVGEKR
jgi:hypothetical protein